MSSAVYVLITFDAIFQIARDRSNFYLAPIHAFSFGHNLQASRNGDSAGNRDGNEIRAIRD